MGDPDLMGGEVSIAVSGLRPDRDRDYRQRMGEILSSEDVHPVAALAIFVDLFWDDIERAEAAQNPDIDPLQWTEPEVILNLRDALDRDPSGLAVDMIMLAKRLLLGWQGPFKSTHDFREAVNILAGTPAVPSTPEGALEVDLVDPEELGVGVWCLRAIAALDDDDEDRTPPEESFSEDVRRLMGWILDEYGLVGSNPEPLGDLPIRTRNQSLYEGIEDMAPEITRIQGELKEEIEGAVRASIVRLNDQLARAPFRHRVAGPADR